jgi:hypothetical protein
MKALILVLVLGMLTVGGCVVGGTAIGQFDHHAAVMDGLANQIESASVSAMADANNIYSFAVVVENERRSARNFSDGLHANAPTYATAATRPTALPWSPKDANGR